MNRVGQWPQGAIRYIINVLSGNPSGSALAADAQPMAIIHVQGWYGNDSD